MEHDADCTLVTFSMTYRKFPVFVLVSGSAKLYLLIQSSLHPLMVRCPQENTECSQISQKQSADECVCVDSTVFRAGDMYA